MSVLTSTLASMVDSVMLAFRPDSSLKTTALALALTSSVICSSIFLILNLIHKMDPGNPPTAKKADRTKRQNSQNNLKKSTPSPSTKKRKHSIPVAQNGLRFANKIRCHRCDKIEPDLLCDRHLCHHCCHGDQVICTFHSNPHQHTKYSPAKEFIDLSGQNLTCCPERIGYSGRQVSGLILSHNLLTQLPDEIGCLQGLTTLDLSYNRLSQLPDCLGNLNQLQSLCVSHNQLCELPSSCSRLHNLQELVMKANKLTILPEVVTQLSSLRNLDVSKNALKLLPETLCTMRNLQDLSVSQNPLTSLPTKLNQLVHLQSLDVSSCELSSLPAGLTSCSSLTRLNACHNKLRWLSSGLSGIPSLKDITLHDNALSYLPLSFFLWLADNKNLTVHNNPFFIKAESDTFQSSPISCQDTGIPLVPSLQELCAKIIMSTDINWKKSNLPTLLKDTLSRLHYCHYCGLPVFDFYRCRFEYHPVSQMGPVPFCHIVCTHHTKAA